MNVDEILFCLNQSNCRRCDLNGQTNLHMAKHLGYLTYMIN